ncbi:MAG: EamA family transporter, partial [Clostridia bacterium]|nr:EamA family transporter [Clostridia bacterium]
MSRFTDEHRGMLAASAAYIIFGFSYLFSKMALNVAEPFILLLARFTTTFLVLNLLVLTGICKISLRGKSLLAPVLVGILQPCLYFVFENYGLAYTTTSFTGMISAVSPIFTAVLGALILKEIPNRKQWFFILVSICGVLMVSLGGSGGKNTIAGCLCLIGAYFIGSFYSLTIRRCSDRFTPFELTYVMFTVGFVFFAVLTFGTYRGETLPMLKEALTHGQFVLSVVYLGIGASVIAYFLANYSIARLPVARATIFGNLSTVVSVTAGVVLMGDPFTWV